LKLLESGLPAFFLRPVFEAVVDGVIFPEACWQVRPRTPGSSDPDCSVGGPAVVCGVSTCGSRLPGKERFDPLILLIRNFVASSHPPEFGSIEAESHIYADLRTNMLLL
jgi:hypothetical protein